ncbi:PEPxxWA-CTERM sorting domain-containing protein [Sphingobium nicotianae]|nr:PEPxxWA-CTERM sorting domain-containing protein [Sphingobium nicotianae]
MMKSLALFCAPVVLAAVPASAANLIVNGDFESGYDLTIPGWQVLANSQAPFIPETIRILKGSDYQACCNTAGAGSSAGALANQFATFGAGNVANNARLYQSFNAVAGVYTLEFDLGAIQGTQRMALSLYDFASSSYVVVDFPFVTGGQNLDTLFTHFSYTFTTAGGRLDLQFDNYLSDTTDVDAFLDNVRVSGAVPEPATWAMMIGGFALAGTAMRRRKAAVSFA